MTKTIHHNTIQSNGASVTLTHKQPRTSAGKMATAKEALSDIIIEPLLSVAESFPPCGLYP